MKKEIKVPFEVMCMDDSNRPNDIPTSKWVKQHNIYTVTKVGRFNVQNGLIGFILKEIDLSDCAPYIAFAAWRFGIVEDNVIHNAEEETFEELGVL